MTEQYSLGLDEAQFAKMLFDHVREMSNDVAGVTRQGYGPLETQVLFRYSSTWVSSGP